MTKIKVHDPITGEKVEVDVPVKKCAPSPRDWVQHIKVNDTSTSTSTRTSYLPRDLMVAYEY